MIDDEPQMRRVLERWLGRRHRVTSVADASSALTLLEELNPDVLLCDLTMPIMTGQAFYERLVQSQPRFVSRFVLMTGGAVSPELAAFLGTTSRPVLRKPFSLAEVEEAIANVRGGDSG